MIFAPPPRPSRVLNVLIAALIPLSACEPEYALEKSGDTGDDGNLHWCQVQCSTEGWDALPLNMVVLTSRVDAPAGAAPTDCDAADTGWPCVHPNSLNERFVDDAGDTIGYTDFAEVTFSYGAALDHADAVSAAGSDPDCLALLALADSVGTAMDFADWEHQLHAAAVACGEVDLYAEGMGNIYLMDNPWGDDDSFNDSEAECLPINFVDVDRLPADPDFPLEFVAAASEHEMGHGFGLAHVCGDPMPDDDDPSNIMHTHETNCCCEAEGTLGSVSSWWRSSVCVDCSADPDAPDECDDYRAYDLSGDGVDDWWEGAPDDDVGCLGVTEFGVGARDLGFSDAEDARQAAGSRGQVEAIVDARVDMCVCACTLGHESANSSMRVVEEDGGAPTCAAGGARVALIPIGTRDTDADGQGTLRLAPVVIEGPPLSEAAWITDLEVVGFGSAARLVLPTRQDDLAYLPNAADTLNAAGMNVLDSGQTGGTLPEREVGTGYAWATDGIDLGVAFVPPIVDVAWDCATAPARDGFALVRPHTGYAFAISKLLGDWEQEVVVRPDFEAGHVWLEMRGYARIYDRVELTLDANGHWAFDYQRDGLTFSGWLAPTGSPVGATLDLHVEHAQMGVLTAGPLTVESIEALP